MAQLLWQQRQDTGPAARFTHGMAYSASAQRTMLFGGAAWSVQGTSFKSLGDTWEWDGEGWVQIADTGPEARMAPQLAFDVARQVAVLFGGQGSGSPWWRKDTWEWDGSAWTQIEDVGPNADPWRSAMVYDSARELMLLHGGSAKSGGIGTWTWDGTAWTQVDDGGPTFRYAFALAFDSNRDRAILFGGWGAGGAQNDTWEWDGGLWKQAEDIGPSSRTSHAMTWDGKSVLLFGGSHALTSAPWAEALIDTWAWDGARWSQRHDMGPPPRWGHALVWDAARNRTVMFGGSGLNYNPLFADTWEAFEKAGD